MGQDGLVDLVDLIRKGLPAPEGGARPVLESLFGSRYAKRHHSPTGIRDAYALAGGDADDGVPFAGLIHPDNPPSGPYGGTSVVWFPTGEHGSLLALGIGTRGLSPDEGILTRPGHQRRITAMRRVLGRRGVVVWSKPDPSALGQSVPKVIQQKFPGFERVFRRYGHEMYCVAAVPEDESAAYAVVQAFFDLYAYERGWQPLKAAEPEFDSLHASLRTDLFALPTADRVNELLRQRRFVVLQGPPGTGKTRLAEEIKANHFRGQGMTVQFHPAVTYEDFVVGLSPDPSDSGLRFNVREGWLVQAARAAREAPFLFVIDEVNRADLGKVLGEAIYLFEAREIGAGKGRSVLSSPTRSLELLTSGFPNSCLFSRR